jgi:hypothetical protein
MSDVGLSYLVVLCQNLVTKKNTWSDFVQDAKQAKDGTDTSAAHAPQNQGAKFSNTVSG